MVWYSLYVEFENKWGMSKRTYKTYKRTYKRETDSQT